MTDEELLKAYTAAYKQAADYKPSKINWTGGLQFNDTDSVPIAGIKDPAERYRALDDLVSRHQDLYWEGRQRDLDTFKERMKEAVRLSHIKTARKKLDKFIKKNKIV